MVHNDPIAPNAMEPVDVPPLPAPWRPADQAGPPLRGCGKPMLLGCGCAATALVAGLILVNANASKLLSWSVGMMRDQVLSGLPSDVSANERTRLESAFEAFPEAADSRRLSADTLFEAFGEINRAAAGAQRGELTRDGVLRLIAALERAVASAARPSGAVRAALARPFRGGVVGGLS